MGRKERVNAEQAGRGKRPPTGRTKVTLSLDDEVAWRLKVKAAMMGVAPGELVDGWIRPHLKGERLPYESYRRGAAPTADVAPGPADDLADRANESGRVLPIGEDASPPGGESSADGPGQGRGGGGGRRRTA